MPRFRILIALLMALTLLSACKTDEERAAEFYDSALSYLDAGDVDRALIELRNVFDNDGFHKEARALYAGLVLERGRVSEAYGQYLRLVEQYPDTVEAREALALMALERRNWDEAVRHGEAAIALDPERIGTRAVASALKYRTGVLDKDSAVAAEAVAEARAVLEEDDTIQAARRVVIDSLLVDEDNEAAMAEIDKALELDPNSIEFNMIRGQLLVRMDRVDELGAQLRRLYELSPENESIRADLIRWYVQQGDFEPAEAFLRDEAGPPAEDIPGNLTVVDLLRRTGGAEAARAELDRLVEEAGDSPAAGLYRTLRASIDFEAGESDAAIAEVSGVLEGAEPGEQTHRIRVILARMLVATGNPVGGREQVEQVLEEDPSNVEALKMRAAWLVNEDRPGAAVIDLRTALDQAPRDTGILMLMAEAYMRDGAEALAQERLSMAVQVSNNGAAESVAYARYLIARNRLQQAETVLTAARRGAPASLEVLGLLGQVYLQQQNWPSARSVIEALRGLGTPQATQLAENFEGGILLGQDRIDEGLEYLRSQLEEDGDGNLATLAQLVRTQILTGRLDEASALVAGELEKAPDSVPLQLMNANIVALQGDLDGAEAIYRGLLEERPDLEPAVLQLQALLRATGRTDEAEALVAEGLDTIPASRRLRLLEAYRMEKEGLYEEAIALYEVLYEEQTSDVVVANNLASMLAEHRRGTEDLDRAYAIARRLTGTDVPPFRDTLGWILYLRGDIDRAIAELEPAAAALPDEASVTAHLGLAYAAAERGDEARETLERALAMPGSEEAPWRAMAQEALSAL